MQVADMGTRPDQIRGAAALVVAMAHAWQVFLYPLDKNAVAFEILAGAAMWAVATFFLLSGILIAMSIRRRVRTGFDLRAYLWARSKRIFPPLLMAVLVTVACVGTIQALALYGAESYWLPDDAAASRDSATMTWQQIIATTTLTYKLIPDWLIGDWDALLFNGPLWSLVYEFWYYIAAGLITAAVVNRSWFSGLMATALCAWMMLVPAAEVTPFWALGAVWGLGFAAGWWWLLLASLPRRRLVGGGAASLTVAALHAREQMPSLLVSSYSGLTQHLFYLLISVAILVAIVLYVRHDRVEGHVGAFFAWLGGFSYTLYLVHFPLLMLLLSLLRPSILQFGAAGHTALALGSLVAVVFAAERLSQITERQYRRTRRDQLPAQ